MSSHDKGDAFTVRIINKERIVAKHLDKNAKHSRVPLSNLDLLLPSEHVGIFFCYKRPQQTKYWSFNHMVSTLKTTLSQTLAHFYVFSGELSQNSLGQPIILCNNIGVQFVEGVANVELRHLNLYNPDQSVEGKLVPKEQHVLISVQATELKCGGIVVACSFDHRIADAYSLNMFLISWSELANSKPITMIPSFNRSLLNPRHPLYINNLIYELYTLISSSLIPHKQDNSLSKEPLISRIYQVNAKHIKQIQSQAKTTKFQSFSAFMWKLISKHCHSLNDDNHSKTCKMGIVVDGRKRLFDEESMGSKANVMSCYFGNVLSIPFGGKTIRELSEKPLSWIGHEIHKFMDKAMTKDHFRDLIDWIEFHRPERALAKVYCQGRDEGPGFVMSSGLRFFMSKVEFGWGKPVFGSYHFPWGGDAGYVMPMQSNNVGNGGWIVYMHLTQGQLEFIEKEASDVFNRLVI